ncbi:hypothetical protein KAR91_61760 [Candidatus Pacearchaeota archaeon]|nr:hypothetical protein [Candidatus Pacearchaeota archaeon]
MTAEIDKSKIHPAGDTTISMQQEMYSIPHEIRELDMENADGSKTAEIAQLRARYKSLMGSCP